MESEFINRLKKAMRDKEMRQTDLSKATGIDRSVISCYLSGRYRPNGKNAVLLSNALGISEAWLMGFDIPKKSDVKSVVEAIESGKLSPPPVSRDDIPRDAVEEIKIDDEDFFGNLSDMALELLQIFQCLDMKGKTKLLMYAYELEKERV